ncbi:MAG: hypothetical protein CSB47_05430 [Proteobacteria bacterium]|nr:MAG: hypothetical protein CSB47_05430 [Pseudomonadota bacterium]
MGIDHKRIESKKELIALIKELSAEAPDKWGNVSAYEFLEALGAWLEDADGFYENCHIEVSPEYPSWQIFADALQAATIYE